MDLGDLRQVRRHRADGDEQQRRGQADAAREDGDTDRRRDEQEDGKSDVHVDIVADGERIRRIRPAVMRGSEGEVTQGSIHDRACACR